MRFLPISSSSGSLRKPAIDGKWGGLTLTALDLARAAKDAEPVTALIGRELIKRHASRKAPGPIRLWRGMWRVSRDRTGQRCACEFKPGQLAHAGALDRRICATRFAMCSGSKSTPHYRPTTTASPLGNDNNANALTLSPMLTERYLRTAANISQLALARPRGVPMPRKPSSCRPIAIRERANPADDLPTRIWRGRWRCGITSCDGDYLFDAPKEGGAGGGFEGINGEPHQLDIHHR